MTPRGRALLVVSAIGLLMLWAAFAHAGSTTFRLVNVIGTTGAQLKQEYPEVYQGWTCQVNTTGDPTELVLRLEGNITGSYYTEMATWTLSADTTYNATTGQGIFGVVAMPAKQVRINILTMTGGTNPRVSVVCTGVE